MRRNSRVYSYKRRRAFLSSIRANYPDNAMDYKKNSSKICDYVKQVLNEYSKIRGKEDLDPNKFWDAVVISASDDNQMKSYERQIKVKQIRKEIPPNVPFHVFADPPGYKIGCGGSAVFVLDRMSHIYGDTFPDMRILFIPAGGYSQRLPNLTCLGKLFCPLPFGDEHFQMLDLILASYLPFLKEMPPGVFLASSDAIISYSLSENDKWTFKNKGFTCIAHPSPIKVGCGHGVYVLPEIQTEYNSSTFMSGCVCVLQKPSITEMREKGAIINDNSGDDTSKAVFSDSTFFFDHKIVSKLIKFYNDNKPIKCELNSYGDFLQPLGELASPLYIAEKLIDDATELRAALFRNLYGSDISILVLKNSFFHHLGTMKEYLESFCFKNDFFSVFPLCKRSLVSWSVYNIIPLYIESTVLHSVIHPMSCVSENTVVEYCDINIAVSIGENCIISNIQLEGFAVQRLPYKIPDNTLMHTVVVQGGFVTIACRVNDDVKKLYRHRHTFQIDFFGKKIRALIAPNVSCFTDNCEKFCLWNAKLFPLKETAMESFMETLKLILCVSEEELQYMFHNFSKDGVKLISMEDILILKDAIKMIDYQQKLYRKIKLKKQPYM